MRTALSGTVHHIRKIGIFKKELKNDIGCYLFLSPFIIGFSVFVLYPIIMSIFYSVTDFNGVYITQIGLFNYADIFDTSKFGMFKDIMKSFGLTFIYAIISIPLNMILSFSLALLIHKNIKGIKTIRLLCYLPVLIPSIAFGQLWKDMLNYPNGLINQFLNDIGLQAMTFYYAEATQLSTLITTSQWGIGGGLIIWLAALNNIPQTLYEAADLDGANYLTKLIKITLPMSSPIIFYNLICAVIACLQTFDSYSFLNRGINDATYFISIRIYVTAFVEKSYGLACSIAWLLFAVIGALTVVMFKTSKWVFYGED
jgi:multiple sugar transport system permease protein